MTHLTLPLLVSLLSLSVLIFLLFLLPPPPPPTTTLTLHRHFPSNPLPPPPKLAYFISGTHGDSPRLLRLLRALYHPNNQYLLHLDRRATPQERVELSASVGSVAVFAAAENVNVVGSADAVNLDGSTPIASLLRGAAILLRYCSDWDWFVNLEASDYPLISQDDLLHILSFVPRDFNFIEHTSNIGWNEYQRIIQIVVDPGLYLASKRGIFLGTKRRVLPRQFRFFTGSPQVILSRKLVEFSILGWDNFPSECVLLTPEEVSFFQLFRILFPGDKGKENFVDSQKGVESTFKRRWIIFISILVQKFLQSVAKPLSWFGSKFETGLNLSSSNGSFRMLLLNCFRGNIQWPDKTSSTFLSFNGHLDKRVELDKSIKPGDSRYHAALSIMSAKASYENEAYIKTTVEDQWKMEFLGFFDFWNDYQEKATTQAFILRDKSGGSDTIIVAFRGTETFDADAWCTDFDLSWYEIPGVGNIHGGFMKALGLKKNLGWPKEIKQDDSHPQVAYYAIREMLREHLKASDQTKFLVTGHSLGAALAILFPAVLVLHEEGWMLDRLLGVYAFGQPRVGDQKFGEFMTEQLKKHSIPYFRFVYCNDLVPRLPYDDTALMFKHFGTCLYFNSSYEGKIVAEEPNKNYFSPLMAMPKTLNAMRELIRSFTIARSKGKEYTEGWFLRFFRVLGLIVPGVSAHGPQDYVNSTRLGSPALFLPHHDPTP